MPYFPLSYRYIVCRHIPGHIEEGGECRGEEYDGDKERVEGALHSAAADRDEDHVGCAGEDATEGLMQNHIFVLILQIYRHPVEMIRDGPSCD